MKGPMLKAFKASRRGANFRNNTNIYEWLLKSSLAGMAGQRDKGGTNMHSIMRMEMPKIRFGESNLMHVRVENCASYCNRALFSIRTVREMRLVQKKCRKHIRKNIGKLVANAPGGPDVT